MMLRVTKRHWILGAALASIQASGILLTFKRTGHVFPVVPVTATDWYFVAMFMAPWITGSAFVTSLILLALFDVVRPGGAAKHRKP